MLPCMTGCKFSAAPQHVFKVRTLNSQPHLVSLPCLNYASEMRAWVQGPELPLQLFHDLGRCFLLDCVLGNADRLCVPELGWRGNPNNLLLGASGQERKTAVVVVVTAHTWTGCRSHSSVA
jgi:hypothetical protein